MASPTKRAKTISVVLTDKPDIQNMTAEELVGLGRSPYTNFWGRMSTHDQEITKKAMTMVGIESLSSQPFLALSDGERQKVMIAKALAQETPIILLDEPTAFLDYPSKVDVLQLLKKLAHELDKTIFLSTFIPYFGLNHPKKLLFIVLFISNSWLIIPISLNGAITNISSIL